MADDRKLHPYTLETELTGYMPVPRELIQMQLPSTAVLIYSALLDRGTLSRKNHYTDEAGQIYVIFPIERLADLFHLNETASAGTGKLRPDSPQPGKAALSQPDLSESAERKRSGNR